MTTDDSLHIDLDAVIRKRLPRQYRYIPRFLIRRLEKIIRQDGLNRLLDNNRGKSGPDFCAGVLNDLNVSYRIHGAENLPDSSDRRFVIVSNHPLGALDGIAMIDLVNRRYGSPIRFVVNDLLTAITPLADVFVPINKHGRQSREASVDVEKAFASDDPVIMFPAGLCSRRGDDGEIRDLEWHKMFVNKCAAYRRDIIPVYFDGRNSSFFYNFARIRARLGLKFNIEMIFLPGEVFKAGDSCFDIYVGNRIDHNTLHSGKSAGAEASRIRNIVYGLKR